MKLKKLTGSILIASASVFALVACKGNADDASTTKSTVSSSEVTPTSTKDQLSYSLGNIIGQRIKSDFDDINNTEVTQGLQDALAGNKPLLSQDEMQKTIEKAQQAKMAAMQKQLKEEAKENLARGNKFLADNAKKPGVKTTSSGLEYKNITNSLTKEDKAMLFSYLKSQPVSSNEKPTTESTVTVSYVGTYTDKKGTHTFDSSEKRKEAAQFKVGQVIKGWQEGLTYMKQGETFELYIPPKLGYGENGIPGVIPPNAVLTFKVTLVKIENPTKKVEKSSATHKSDSTSSKAMSNS